MITVAQIEQAIQDRLTERIPYLKSVGSIADFLTADLDQNTGLTPAAYVVFESGAFDHQIGMIQQMTLRYTVIVVVRNRRGNEAARRGAGQEIGAYQVLDDIRLALTHQTLGLGIDPLMPESIQGIAGSESVAVYGITFETRCEDTIN